MHCCVGGTCCVMQIHGAEQGLLLLLMLLLQVLLPLPAA
jgi:hypothetical protein